MHTGRERKKEPDVIADQFAFLEKSIAIARAAGVAGNNIVLDPGFGFAKETAADNLELMARFEELHTLGFPLAVGTSRKRFVGAVTGRAGVDDRDVGTAATSVILRMKGAVLFRVHNVAINVDALKMADAMLAHAPEG
jgi:dihydropteroate synthase